MDAEREDGYRLAVEAHLYLEEVRGQAGVHIHGVRPPLDVGVPEEPGPGGDRHPEEGPFHAPGPRHVVGPAVRRSHEPGDEQERPVPVRVLPVHLPGGRLCDGLPAER